MRLARNMRWEVFVAIITAVSVIVIVVDYGYDFSANEKLAVYVFDTSVVAILIIDFRRRMIESGEGYRYLRSHWYEIPAMLPIFVFDSFEQYVTIGVAMRTMRLVRLFRLIQLLSRTATIFANTRYVYMVILSGGAVILGGLAMYVVESGNDQANIQSVGDGIWWAIVTVTTVGYGDRYPVTIGGRIIASVIMVIGISLLGFFISTLGATLVESKMKKRLSTVSNEPKNIIKNKIDRLENMHVDDISNLIASITELHRELCDTSQLPHCNKCSNKCPINSLFCNFCGNSLSSN